MSDALTARQTQILKAITDEYIATAEPVGSESLDKKYSLGISPATIRNEMSNLIKTGYLKQPHTSSGRMPTPKAMKFYVDQLMVEKQMSLTDEVKAKEEVWDSRNDLNELMDDAVRALSQRTKSLAIGTLDEGKVWRSGYANIFLDPEFSDMEVSASLFGFLEEARRMHELFFEKMTGVDPIELLFGEELGWTDLPYLGVVGTRFTVQNHECALGVIGSTRQSYQTVFPVLRYFRQLIQEISGK